MNHGTEDNLFLVDSAITHHYEKSEIFLRIAIPRKVSTIVGPMQIFKYSGRAHTMRQYSRR